MHRRGRRHGRAIIGGLTILAAVVVGEAAPAPGQVPDLPDIDVVEGFGPVIISYGDCTDVVHLEEIPMGVFFIELDEPVEADQELTLSFSGSLAGSLVETPTATVAEGESYVDVGFELVEFETGDLTLTVEPGVGYTAGPEDTSTIEVTDEIYESFSCHDDLAWLIEDGTDRQTIGVGDRPEPLGLLEGIEIPGEEPPVSTSTTSTSTTTTEVTTTTGLGDDDQSQDRVPAAVRAVPEGFDTPTEGTLPPGLTYVDDVWSGAATTAGTYTFDVRLCVDQTAFAAAAGASADALRPAARAFPDVICLGTVDVRIVVEADASTPPATAPPANPVVAPARFAG